MFVAVSLFSESLTRSNFISIVMPFLFYEAPPSEKVTLHLEAMMKWNTFLQTKEMEFTIIQYGVQAGTDRHRIIYEPNSMSRNNTNGNCVVTTNRCRSGMS